LNEAKTGKPFLKGKKNENYVEKFINRQ